MELNNTLEQVQFLEIIVAIVTIIAYLYIVK